MNPYIRRTYAIRRGEYAYWIHPAYPNFIMVRRNAPGQQWQVWGYFDTEPQAQTAFYRLVNGIEEMRVRE